jgi:type II secretion system protein N
MENKKRLWLISTSVFGGSFVLGLIFFFPLQKLQSSIVSLASKSTGMDIQISELRFATGFGLGLSKGSVLGVRAHNLSVTNQAGKNLSCDEAVVAPHVWPLLLGQIRLGVWCNLDAKGGKTKELGAVTLMAKLSPFWNPKSLGLDVSFDQLNLTKVMDFAVPAGQFKIDATGKLSGEFSISDMSLTVQAGRAPKLEMDLNADNLAFNQIEVQGIPAVSIPINFGKTSIKGNTDGPKITVNPIRFKSSELEGQMEIDLSMGARGMLESMVWKGSIKSIQTNPSRDLVSLLNSNFGPVDASGFRDFVKRVEGGNIMALMGPPTE